MVIRKEDRVADVLARDERLVETFVAASPAFAMLRNPVTRRTLARLATVEAAARVAGIDADALTESLNRAASGDGSARAPLPATPPRAPGPPRELLDVPAERVLDLDVREDLRNGREPFSRIMAARRDLPGDGVLRLRAVFEPVPLYAVMAKQGYAHWTERLADDDWRVWFHRAPAAAPMGEASADLAEESPPEAGIDDLVVLDVRGLDPPEPMVRTLAALEALPAGKRLVQVNERVPEFLLPRLAELGFEYEVRDPGEGPVRVFIRRADS